MNQYIHGSGEKEQDRLSFLNKITNQSYISFLQLNGDEKIIDIGSGMGELAYEIGCTYPKVNIVGVELSEEQLEKAPKDLSNIEFKKGDARSLPAPDESFNVAYMRYLLEHVNNPLQALLEAKRVLKKDGKLYLQENNILCMQFFPSCVLFMNVWKKFSILQEKLGGDALIGKKLYSLAKQAGFSNITLSIEPEVHYYGSHAFNVWIENLIQNVKGAKKLLIENNLCNEEDICKAIDELEDFRNNEMASTYFYWNRLMAIK